MTRATGSDPGGALRIGVLGGTFNPIHFGHLRMAEALSESFSLRPFIFIPAAVPPHKSTVGLCSGDQRIEMIRKASADNPLLQVSDMELRRGGTSYSVETIEALLKEYVPPARIFFTMADDSFAEIETWKDWRRIFTLVDLIVVSRPGTPGRDSRELLPVEMQDTFCYSENDDAYLHTSGKRVYFRDFGALQISSTMIRELVRTSRSIRYLVPEGVREFIQQHGLYLKPETGVR